MKLTEYLYNVLPEGSMSHFLNLNLCYFFML